MKISIDRLKETIMEEVARATALEEKSDAVRQRDQDRCAGASSEAEYRQCMNEYGLEETIEIVDDE